MHISAVTGVLSAAVMDISAVGGGPYTAVVHISAGGWTGQRRAATTASRVRSAAAASAGTDGPADSTSRLELASTDDRAAPNTARSSAGPAPCAPTPGASSGARQPTRSSPRSATAVPTVAP